MIFGAVKREDGDDSDVQSLCTIFNKEETGASYMGDGQC